MKAFSRSMPRAKARRGFTLIELIVVLMILVGLAGMVIPAVTDMVERTHTSTAAGNLHEVSNAVARYEVQYLGYPNQLDGLKTTLAGAAEDEFSGLADGLLGVVEVGTLTAAQVDSLVAAGITNVQLSADPSATVSATFQTTTTSTDLADTSVLLFLTAGQTVTLGLEPGAGVANKYLCLGVGDRSELIGKTMTSAPVHFPDNGNSNPNDTYQRFIGLFDVSGERAKFVGALAPEGASLNHEFGHYFEIVSDN